MNNVDILAILTDEATNKAIEKFLAEVRGLDWDNEDYDKLRQYVDLLIRDSMEFTGRAISELAADVYAIEREDAIGEVTYEPVLAPEVLDLMLQEYERNEIIRASIAQNHTNREAMFAEQSNYLDRTLRNVAHNTMAANRDHDSKAKRYQVKLAGSAANCARKNRHGWDCHSVALMVEALGKGEKPEHWFHPHCKCVVEVKWQKLPKPKPAKEWTNPPCPEFKLTKQNEQVLLHGIPGTPKGWHYDPYGLNTYPGKTFAPAWMSEKEIIDAINLTLKEPQFVENNGSTNTVRFREINRVIWKAETWTDANGVEHYKHLYPLNGDGVTGNDANGQRHEVPLDRSVLGVV